jgi:hypothetical protein
LWLFTLLLLAGIVAGTRLAPTIWWAYNVEKAGALMDQGMAWPDPRLSDSLPTVTDDAALDAALGHLAAAKRWRPTHYHAYRLVGQIYLAKGDWLRAVENYHIAQALDPKQPLLGWEAGLAYEQMLAVVDGAPNTPIRDQLLAGQITVPSYDVSTPFCNERGRVSCYVAATEFAQPYAGLPGTWALRLPVLFQHPPAQVEQRFVVPADQPALRFVLGLDPGLRTAGSDGATFRIWVTPIGGSIQLIYEGTLDARTARQGWLGGWANLSPWAGQEVTLRLGTDSGPAGDATADWVGWGDLAFTTVEAARYAAAAPLANMQSAWSQAGLGRSWFEGRVAEAQRKESPERAALWALRTNRMP